MNKGSFSRVKKAVNSIMKPVVVVWLEERLFTVLLLMSSGSYLAAGPVCCVADVGRRARRYTLPLWA